MTALPPRRSEKTEPYQADALRRAVQSVMRRGFTYDVVRAAADQYKEELEWEE